ncbi:MAG TPA: LptA/OstA family protein [Polyangiaceae bacterium]|nr:LptA/OstA family protein [Polyangiaceae bacterium]
MTRAPLRHTFRLLGFAGLTVVSLLGVSHVPEARADLATISGQALDVKANKLDVDINRGRATLEGDVHATLGELTVVCPKVELAYDEAPQVKWARGTGGVEARVQGVVARAAVVEVDVAKRKVDLSGGVRLTRGQGWVEAERASIDISTYRVSLHEVKGSIPVKPPARD